MKKKKTKTISDHNAPQPTSAGSTSHYKTNSTATTHSWFKKKRRLFSSVVLREHLSSTKNRHQQQHDDSDTTTTLSGTIYSNGADCAPWRVGNVLPHGAPTENDWWEVEQDHPQEKQQQSHEQDGETINVNVTKTDNISKKEEPRTTRTAAAEVCDTSSSSILRFRNCGYEAWLQCRNAWRAPPHHLTTATDSEEYDGNDNDSYEQDGRFAAPTPETTATKPTKLSSSSSMRAVLSRQRCLKRKLVKVLGDGSRKCQLPQRVSLGDVIDAYKNIWKIDDVEDLYPE